MLGSGLYQVFLLFGSGSNILDTVCGHSLPETLWQRLWPCHTLPTKTRTQKVTERRVQHPEEQQELPELPLHGLLTLLKVPVLWGEGHVRG